MQKAIDTVSVVASVLSLMKVLGVVFTMTMLEWARKRAQKAEDREAVAKADLKIKNYLEKVDAKYHNKPGRAIIDDYLKRHPGE